MNSYLQVRFCNRYRLPLSFIRPSFQTLFHILPIRRILFNWHYPPPALRERGKRYDLVAALQSLFVHLQLKPGQVVDPQQLVNAAGVNVTQQQDVQEFSVLFLAWLDRVLAERPGEEKLQRLFTGKLRTTIR